MTPDRRDIVDIDGRRKKDGCAAGEPTGKKDGNSGRRFLSVLFRCCNTYGRLYPDSKRTRYEGRCPKCGTRIEAGIGPGGTNRNVFDTH